MPEISKIDPLGQQPPPLHGDPRPNYADHARSQRVSNVLPFFKTNFIEHQPQTDLVNQLLSYIASTLPLLGGPIDGRALSEHSNAGKSRMIERLVVVAAERRAEAGLEPKPHQILVFELDQTSGITSFYRQILRKMGHDFADDKRAAADELEERIHHIGRKPGLNHLQKFGKNNTLHGGS